MDMTSSEIEPGIHAVDARTWRYADRCETPLLSLKWLARGRAIYRIGRRRHEVAGDALLVLGPGHPYEVTVDEPDGAESFCLFVSDTAAAAMWTAVASPAAVLIDDPALARGADFPDLVVHGWRDLVARTRALRALLSSRRPVADTAQQLLLEALRRIAATTAGTARLPAIRATTRDELARRLSLARDYIIERSPALPSLDELARIACMSPYHLQRCFALVFGESPAAYATRLRSERAARLVATTRRSLADIALDVGFTSQAAFTRSFRRWHGVPPRRYRERSR